MDSVEEEEVIEGDCTPGMDSGLVVKQEPAWSMEEDSPDQPSAVYSTAQPMSDNTSGSLLSLKRGRVCQYCSAAFVLVSSLELHLASVHGDSLPFFLWTESSDRQMSLPHGELSTEETDHVGKHSADLDTEFVLKLEPAWSMDEDSPDQPSAVYSTAQPMSDNTSGSLLFPDTRHICYICFDAFLLLSRFELHLALAHGEKLHVVLPGSSTPDRCDAGNCSNTDIDKEVDSHIKGKMTANKVDDTDTGDKDGMKRKRQHVCDVCSKSFTKPSDLKRHKVIHSGVKAFICDVCSKRFSRAFDLKTHKLTHSGQKPFVCDVCGKSFTHASHLKTHKLTHSDYKPFVCDVCGKSYTQASDLKRHMLTHSSHKPFVCDICFKGFTQASDLTRHKRIHTGERPYKCPHCDKDFNVSGNLQYHINSVHNGASSHVCDICGSTFSKVSDLAMHLRIHTGQNSHVCSDCGKGFTRPSSLVTHRLTHTGEKPHVCSDCGKSFAVISNLRQHCLIHTGEKPHSCPHCPAVYRRSENLKTHIQSKHQ